jgi:hypothetical protein
MWMNQRDCLVLHIDEARVAFLAGDSRRSFGFRLVPLAPHCGDAINRSMSCSSAVRSPACGNGTVGRWPVAHAAAWAHARASVHTKDACARVRAMQPCAATNAARHRCIGARWHCCMERTVAWLHCCLMLCCTEGCIVRWLLTHQPMESLAAPPAGPRRTAPVA